MRSCPSVKRNPKEIGAQRGYPGRPDGHAQRDSGTHSMSGVLQLRGHSDSSAGGLKAWRLGGGLVANSRRCRPASIMELTQAKSTCICIFCRPVVGYQWRLRQAQMMRIKWKQARLFHQTSAGVEKVEPRDRATNHKITASSFPRTFLFSQSGDQ